MVRKPEWTVGRRWRIASADGGSVDRCGGSVRRRRSGKTTSLPISLSLRSSPRLLSVPGAAWQRGRTGSRPPAAPGWHV